MLVMYKNRLQEYVQRLGLPLPSYQSINEGLDHAPMFKTVTVDGEEYHTHHAFKHVKDAEQDAARIALELLPRKILDQCASLISKDTIFCKSILIEFMVKLNMGIPSYSTVKTEGLLPAFVSSVSFDGVKYTGDIAKCKKEAEQMAARKVIQTILGSNSDHRNLLSQIIRSKSRLYPPQNQDVISIQNTEMVVMAPSLVSPETNFPGLPIEQEVEDCPLGTTLKLKKPRTEYLSDQNSRFVNDQPGINQIDVLSQAVSLTIVEAAKRVNKVLLEMVHSNGTSMIVPVGNLQKNVSDSSGKNEESMLTAGASVFKSHEALGCSSEKPSTHGNDDSMDSMHLMKNQSEKSVRNRKNKKRSEKSS